MRDAAAPDAASLPSARTVAAPPRRYGWFVALGMLPPGWLFIAHAHRWHVSPSVVVLCLCWTALIGGGYALVRATNAVVEEVGDDWFVVGGSRGELEREKKSLIRAIKEIEFDRDTGKLTAADAQAMIATYRARAIEVIKVLDAPPQLSPRERILAEIQARAKLAKVAAKAQQKAKQKAGKGAGKQAGKPADQALARAVEAPVVDEPDAGHIEAGNLEAGKLEASNIEAGKLEASEPDAGEPDAGDTDAGDADAGDADAGDADVGASVAAVAKASTEPSTEITAASSPPASTTSPNRAEAAS